MKEPHQIKIKSLNRYSWSLIFTFICATLAMEYHTARVSFEEFFQTFPLIIILVYWCQKSAFLITLPECKLKKIELFRRDLFISNFSFLLGCLISLILAYDNSDAKGWWPLILYFLAAYGLVFSAIFSTIAQLIKNHKTYTIIFSILLITLISLGNFFPRYIPIPYLGSIDIFYLMTCTLIIVHLLFSITCKIISLTRKLKRKP
jgi:hypothetical protein